MGIRVRKMYFSKCHKMKKFNEMKDWKQICDEVFCAWMKFESNTYKCAVKFSEYSIVVTICRKYSSESENYFCLVNDNVKDSDLNDLLSSINQYSDNNEVIENIDFQQELMDDREKELNVEVE